MTWNIASAVAIGTSMTGALSGTLAARLSRGPGWSHLRWFAAASFLTAVFGLSDVGLLVTSDEDLLLLSGQLNLASGVAQMPLWLAFFAEWEQRPLARFERVVASVCGVGAAATLVPGLVVRLPVVEHTVAWAGVTYRDLHQPAFFIPVLGAVFWAILLLTPRALRIARAKQGSWTLAVAFSLLVIAAANDMLAAVGLLPTPYFLDAAFILICLGVGATVTRDLVEGARALEDTSRRLSETRAALVKQERLAAVGELAAVIAHEVRNPLAVIFNVFATLRREGTSAREGDELLAVVEEEAQRLSRLVDGLLDFVRHYEPRRALVDVGALVSHAAEAALSETGSPPDAVVTTSPASTTVSCDELLLQQALANLVKNALQTRERRGPVRVTARVDDTGDVTFEVRDDGAGVPASQRERLFSPFFTTRQTGIGLGLALVRRIAEAHEGTIHHEETPGGGATFVLRLPRAAVSAQAPTTTA